MSHGRAPRGTNNRHRGAKKQTSRRKREYTSHCIDGTRILMHHSIDRGVKAGYLNMVMGWKGKNVNFHADGEMIISCTLDENGFSPTKAKIRTGTWREERP